MYISTDIEIHIFHIIKKTTRSEKQEDILLEGEISASYVEQETYFSIGRKQYMRYGIVSYVTLLGLMTSAFAAGPGDKLTDSDVTKSTVRLQKAFQEKPLSKISFEGSDNSMFVTCRASQGIEELGPCVDKVPFPLRDVGLNLRGSAHRGLTESFPLKTEGDLIVYNYVAHKKRSQPLSDPILIIEGSSAGAHRALATACFVKQHPDMQNIPMIVLRYATGKTYDDLAVSEINQLIGQGNIFEFHAEGDKIAECMDMAGVTTSPGIVIPFSPSSKEFGDRVETQAFTGMEAQFRNMLVSDTGKTFLSLARLGLSFLPSSSISLGNFSIPCEFLDFLNSNTWERHQDKTYGEHCPQAFAHFKGGPSAQTTGDLANSK
jgi:hypothetical protein